MEAIDQFQQAMTAAGQTPPDVIHADGKLHRYSTDGKPSHRNGWYFLHLDGTQWGEAGDWSVNGGEPVCHWCTKSDTAMTQAERDTQRAQQLAMRMQRDDDLAQRQQQAAAHATKRVTAAKPCTQHPYLSTKGVQGYGVKIEGDNLLIPMRDTAGTLHSLQTITPDGDKMFMSGGRVKGCYHSIGKPAGLLIVCEGYATGASIHEATGHAVAVAFNAGNLDPAAVALSAKYPALKIIIAADDDHGMGADSAMRNMALLNQLWDGASLKVDRRSSESFTVRGARLTMALQVQEATIRAFFASTKGLARGTGFLARFLVSWPQSTQGTRNFTEAPANWPALATFNNRLTAILNRPAPIDDDGHLIPAMLTLAPDAKAANDGIRHWTDTD